MDANWVVLARIVRPQGRRGELLADILTDFPEKFASRNRLFLRSGNAGALDPVREVNLQSHRFHKNRVVLKFTGVDSINDAELLRKYDVVIPLAERMPLAEDAIYISDLLGMRVLDVSGGSARDAGEVVDVAPEGAGPAMLAVRTQDAEPVLIPFVKAYLKKIDLPAKRIEMELPEGLMAIQAPLTAEERAQQEGKTSKSSS
jgi:16S rRNA processing protein RimM